jgi:hypothetical protein
MSYSSTTNENTQGHITRNKTSKTANNGNHRLNPTAEFPPMALELASTAPIMTGIIIGKNKTGSMTSLDLV